MKPIDEQGPETRSADLTGMNVEALKGLFPEAFIEGKIDFEVLKQLLGGAVDDREEKYGLNWHGKRQARQLALTPSTGTLRPSPLDSIDWDSTQNLMIEGDNLEVLKLLQKSYPGKVKVIYIDPPYNTGNDFVYKDDFRDSIKTYLARTGQTTDGEVLMTSNPASSGRFHTDWLNMIYPRLLLAKNLLSRDGIIFISMDEHELVGLTQVCFEVFGEENFVAHLIWEKGRKNDAKLFSVGHEYVLVFLRDAGTIRESGVIWREEKPGAREIWAQYVLLRQEHDSDNAAVQAGLREWFSGLPATHPSKKWSRYKNIDEYGPWRDDNISWPGGGGPRYDVLHPVTHLPCKVPERGWIFSTIEEMQRRIRLGVVEFREDHTQPPFRKSHLRPLSFELLEEEDSSVPDEAEADDELATQVRGSYFYKQSQVAIKAIRKLMGSKVFSNPKDHEEIARLIKYVTESDPAPLVVDFFAGSGTTGHAVWDLNAADSGHRRFILVQIPQNLSPTKREEMATAAYLDSLGHPLNLSELTKERLRRASEKIKAENPMFHGDLGFRVFKLDSTNIRPWEPNRDKLTETLEESVEHIKDGRTDQDILFEILLKLGLELTVDVDTRTIASKAVYSVGIGTLLVCLAQSIDAAEVESLALGIVDWHTSLAPAVGSTVVFRDSAFADDVAKTNLTAILTQHGLENVRSL